MTVRTAQLSSRALLKLSGSEAVSFLQNLVTCSVDALKEDDAAFGALLTPQGKILFDFFLVRTKDGFLLDVDQAVRTDLAKRLAFYKLRADVTIENSEDDIFAGWGADDLTGVADPRSALMGTRLYGAKHKSNASEEEWHAMRIAIGMPHSGLDFSLGARFPHEVLMDQFGGIDFSKGCYVGQEVVSRMHHRGTTRNRIVCVIGNDEKPLPPTGTEVLADERAIGTLAGSIENTGLAIVRLDRLKAAIDKGASVTAAGVALTFSQPKFATYEWPL